MMILAMMVGMNRKMMMCRVVGSGVATGLLYCYYWPTIITLLSTLNDTDDDDHHDHKH